MKTRKKISVLNGFNWDQMMPQWFANSQYSKTPSVSIETIFFYLFPSFTHWFTLKHGFMLSPVVGTGDTGESDLLSALRIPLLCYQTVVLQPTCI